MSEKGGRKKSSRWENWKASSPIKVVIIGAGQRGSAYATYGMDFPEKMKVVGVAEPRRTMRSDFQKAFSLPDDKFVSRNYVHKPEMRENIRRIGFFGNRAQDVRRSS
ncbi:unnamed protein product [Notodromas monacha]|uniref:Uncharacterized protein n=1 Tax=Notodromas monacha TaxID=399045 RepID=A0A7R9C099_9CRUS|nr:unnamed protein product [Notodromas monacha]CAG0923383.1 unnamed protein product [Notodromas monacha]